MFKLRFNCDHKSENFEIVFFFASGLAKAKYFHPLKLKMALECTESLGTDFISFFGLYD